MSTKEMYQANYSAIREMYYLRKQLAAGNITKAAAIARRNELQDLVEGKAPIWMVEAVLQSLNDGQDEMKSWSTLARQLKFHRQDFS